MRSLGPVDAELLGKPIRLFFAETEDPLHACVELDERDCGDRHVIRLALRVCACEREDGFVVRLGLCACVTSASSMAPTGRWHAVLRQACHNPTITEILERLALQLALYDSADMTRTVNLESTDDEHAQVLAAIAAGDQDTARQVLRQHLERTRDVRIAALVRAESSTA